MRMDAGAFFYFVDRIGDTFRWKGENVATSEVAAAIAAFPGIQEANVYGVRLPGTEGAAGMAAIVADGELDLAEFRKHLARELPPYARPLFLRITDKIAATATFKHTKSDLAREGFDPAATSNAIYFNDPAKQVFARLGGALFERIQAGKVRL
jgi:fatty-acyl-CoA synthase